MYGCISPIFSHKIFNGINWLWLTLSRSLILCHSKTNDDGVEDRNAGEVADGCRVRGPSWRTLATAAVQTGCRDTESGHCRATRHSAPEKRGGSKAEIQLHHTATLRENKRGIRRSFSIKVRLQELSYLKLIRTLKSWWWFPHFSSWQVDIDNCHLFLQWH